MDISAVEVGKNLWIGVFLSIRGKLFKNQVLDEIIISRRTIRDFRPEFPAEGTVMQSVTAGLHAPYAKTAVENFTTGYFRRFFIMRRGSGSMAAASALYRYRQQSMSPVYRKRMASLGEEPGFAALTLLF